MNYDDVSKLPHQDLVDIAIACNSFQHFISNELIETSKWHISPEEAIDRIREYMQLHGDELDVHKICRNKRQD